MVGTGGAVPLKAAHAWVLPGSPDLGNTENHYVWWVVVVAGVVLSIILQKNIGEKRPGGSLVGSRGGWIPNVTAKVGQSQPYSRPIRTTSRLYCQTYLPGSSLSLQS